MTRRGPCRKGSRSPSRIEERSVFFKTLGLVLQIISRWKDVTIIEGKQRQLPIKCEDVRVRKNLAFKTCHAYRRILKHITVALRRAECVTRITRADQVKHSLCVRRQAPLFRIAFNTRPSNGA